MNTTPYRHLFRPMQVYRSKTTREHKPAPEIRWIVGEDVRIIGFDEFEYQTRLSIARLDGEDCNIINNKNTEFFTEVPSISQLDSILNDTEVIVDPEVSSSCLMIYAENFQYQLKKIPGSEILEFREQYLPIDQPTPEGSILSSELYHLISQSPGELLRVKVMNETIEFVSRTIDEKIRYGPIDTGTVSSEIINFECSFDMDLLSETISKFPKHKPIQFFITEEFIRFRYELGEVGYLNYYQRAKNSKDTYVI